MSKPGDLIVSLAYCVQIQRAKTGLSYKWEMLDHPKKRNLLALYNKANSSKILGQYDLIIIATAAIPRTLDARCDNIHQETKQNFSKA